MLGVDYVLDSSALIHWSRNTPRAAFPSLWDQVGLLLGQSRAVVPEEVVHELERGTDDLAAWVKAAASPHGTTKEVLNLVKTIARRYPTWATNGTRNGADPFVVATAVICEATVITQEGLSRKRPASARPSIPSVCADYGLIAIGPNDLIAREGWRF